MKRSISFLPNWKNLFRFMRDPKADWKPKVAIVLAVAYLLWPIDLVPDLIPLFGWLEDVGVTALATAYLLNAASNYEPTKEIEDKESKN